MQNRCLMYVESCWYRQGWVTPNMSKERHEWEWQCKANNSSCGWLYPSLTKISQLMVMHCSTWTASYALATYREEIMRQVLELHVCKVRNYCWKESLWIFSTLTPPYCLYNEPQMQLNVLTGTRHTADVVSNLSDNFFPLRTCASVLLQSAAVRFSTTSGIPNFLGPEFTSFPNFMKMHPQLTFRWTNWQTEKRMMEVIKYSYVLQKLTVNICWQLEIQITTTHNLLASHSLSSVNSNKFF